MMSRFLIVLTLTVAMALPVRAGLVFERDVATETAAAVSAPLAGALSPSLRSPSAEPASDSPPVAPLARTAKRQPGIWQRPAGV